MVKILIVFHSKTGGTYQMAQAAARGAGAEPDAEVVECMVNQGLVSLVGGDSKDPRSAWKRFFEPGDVVGIKVNPVGRAPKQPDLIHGRLIVLGQQRHPRVARQHRDDGVLAAGAVAHIQHVRADGAIGLLGGCGQDAHDQRHE